MESQGEIGEQYIGVEFNIEGAIFTEEAIQNWEDLMRKGFVECGAKESAAAAAVVAIWLDVWVVLLQIGDDVGVNDRALAIAPNHVGREYVVGNRVENHDVVLEQYKIIFGDLLSGGKEALEVPLCILDGGELICDVIPRLMRVVRVMRSKVVGGFGVVVAVVARYDEGGIWVMMTKGGDGVQEGLRLFIALIIGGNWGMWAM